MNFAVNFVNWILAGLVAFIGGNLFVNLSTEMLDLHLGGTEYDIAGVTLCFVLILTAYGVGGFSYLFGKFNKKLFLPLDRLIN